MLNRVSRWIHARANWKTVLVSLVLMSAFYYVFFYTDLPFSIARLQRESGGQMLLDLTPNYTPEQGYRVLDAYGEAGRATYGHILLADLFYPAVYTAALTLTLSVVLRRAFPADSPAQCLNLVPLLGGLFDYAENIGEYLMWSNYPAHLDGVATVTSKLTVLKLIIGNLCFMGLGLCIVVWVARQFALTRGLGKFK